jgi:hypothetical protein
VALIRAVRLVGRPFVRSSFVHQVAVGEQSNHGMTAVQLARLRARRNGAEFNRMRFLQFLDAEAEGVELDDDGGGGGGGSAVRPVVPGRSPAAAAGGGSNSSSKRVAWSDGGASSSSDGGAGGGGGIGSPNEVRRAEDPAW